MAGHFELIDDPGAGYRVRLLDSGGKVLAVSERYDNTESAARGIFAIREIAASALIDDKRGTSNACPSEVPWTKLHLTDRVDN